jgi:hypothetical protein
MSYLPGMFWRQGSTACEVVGLPHISRASAFEQVLMTWESIVPDNIGWAKNEAVKKPVCPTFPY